MKNSVLTLALLLFQTTLGVLSFAAGPAPGASATVTPVDVINTMESGGIHAGFRRNHAKGLCFEGTFKPTKDASNLSSSNLFEGPTSTVMGRFSNPGPNPASADNAPMPRGMALQFHPEKGDTSNMSMLNVPAFAVSTPEAFNELLKVKTPEQIAVFKKKYPRSEVFFKFVETHGVPQSFTTVDFHSLHAFKFTNKKGQSQYARWNFISQQGNLFLTADQAKSKSANFLSEGLVSELKKGPVSWDMEAILAKERDSLTDPSAEWKGDHKKIKLGTLKITKTTGNGEGPCDMINFDPNNLAAGIESSDDPILKFRSPAYGLSFGKRATEKAKAQ